MNTHNDALDKGISVLMPVYNQGAFISRAISSLRLQTYKKWELLIINDGSDDYTPQVIEEVLYDTRIRYLVNKENRGIGYSLNRALTEARFDIIAYLPADDIFFKDHLQTLIKTLNSSNAIAAFSGVAHHYADLVSNSTPYYAEGMIEGEPLQLVQTMHRKTADRWVERTELVTDDLDIMYWNKLRSLGTFAYTGRITCEWVDHPEQHHKITRENMGGGIYLYKQFYKVAQPLRYKTSVGNLIDEAKAFKIFQVPPPQPDESSLTILLVGELAYNPERILALEALGHKLFAVWIKSPANFTTTGPLPFGNIITIAEEDLEAEIPKIKPDIIYALLNQHAVPLANLIMRAGFNIPFVWHFKEGPFICRQNGLWNMLVELYTNADGRIFTNQESREWFCQFIQDQDEKSLILDGDLPKREWFLGERSTLISETDGEPHTLVAGRPYGITPEHIMMLAEQKVHLHFYGDIQHTYWRTFMASYPEFAKGYLHIHHQCDPSDWRREFSKYDAGWLHLFDSQNENELMRATWPDLNYPARLSTYAAAGLPMMLKNNARHLVATQNLVTKLDIGICFDAIDGVGDLLRNQIHMRHLRANMEKHRMAFCFDTHAPQLISFFRRIIQNHELQIQQIV